DVDAAALAVEADDPLDQGEQRVVPAAGHVAPGVVARAALPHQDAAGADELAAVGLDPQALAVRLAPVLDRPLPLLVSHDYLIIGGLTSGLPPPAGVPPSLGISSDEAR